MHQVCPKGPLQRPQAGSVLTGREHYDAGERRVEPFDPFKVTKWRVIAGDNPGYLVATPMQSRSDGWNVTCQGCGKQFESKGRAFCSKDCKEQSAEREATAAEMAEIGMDLPTKRPCQAPGCSDHITGSALLDSYRRF